MGKKKGGKDHQDLKPHSASQLPSEHRCYEGERLDALLKRLEREIESAKLLKGTLPDKIWIKQQFAIGVNDVTRILERMPCVEADVSGQEDSIKYKQGKVFPVPLQAVLLASDINPRFLTKHLPVLASSRRVPLIFVRDEKAGSLRLGELVKLKTAMAIGVKARGSGINKAVEEVLRK